MRKKEQIAINEEVRNVWNTRVLPEFATERPTEWKKLRSCSAEVTETTQFYILKSYNTIIAVIEKSTDTLYDALRLVYGYTSTSAQHISKFSKDYGYGKWGCENRVTYREV